MSLSVTLEPLISFRVSIDKLNDEEFKTFTTKWISMLDRNLIISTIFRSFNHPPFDQKNYNLKIITNTIMNIINSRKKTKNKDLSITTNIIKKRKIKLIELPSSLIGKIGSFLYQSDYINFERLCRQIYIPCNKPSRMLYLHRRPSRYLHCNVRNKYPLLNKLSIGLHALVKSMKKYSNYHRFNHLESLILNGKYCVFPTDIDQFIEHNNLINLENIKNLKCVSFKNITFNFAYNRLNEHIDIDVFYKFLGNFPNLENLDLISTTLTNDDDDDNDILSKLLPKLKGFSAGNNNNPSFCNKIVNLYGNQLELLNIFDQNSSNIHSKNGFNKLTDLSLTSPSIDTINNIVNTTKILQRFGIRMIRNPTMSDDELQNILIKLIKTQKSLEYIGFDVSLNGWKKIINVILNVLTQIKEIDKKEFKIKFRWFNCNEINIKEINSDILSITKQLNQSNIKHFMFDLTFFVENRGEMERGEMMESLNKEFVAQYEFNEIDKYHRFMISNKNCIISGYDARWIDNF